MKIGVDATSLRDQLTGVGNYLFYLLKYLVEKCPEDRFFLYAIRPSRHLDCFRSYPNVTIGIYPFLGFSEALWSQTTLAWLVARDRLDGFWGPGQSVPLFSSTKSLITIHDFAYKLYPQSVSYVRGAYLRLFGKFLYRKATLIAANSQGTAARLKQSYNTSADWIIIPPLKEALPPEDVITRYALSSKGYFLAIGTLEPRKNLIRLVQSYSSHYPLVLAGGKGWRDGSIAHTLQTTKKNIRILGYVPDPALMGLISHAKALIMPSLYEGYGMPIAEARAAGTPVICSNVPEMLEAAEGDAIVLNWPRLEEILNGPILPPRRVTYPSNEELGFKLLQAIKALTDGSYAN